jgi:isoleucyl-tRNA synthetase
MFIDVSAIQRGFYLANTADFDSLAGEQDNTEGSPLIRLSAPSPASGRRDDTQVPSTIQKQVIGTCENTADLNSPPWRGGSRKADGVVAKPQYYHDLDNWALQKTAQYQADLVKAYQSYDFVSTMQAVQHFCSIEMGGFYLDVIKDRLYTYAANSPERRSAQRTLYHILEALVRWIAPVLSFTADEIWQIMPQKRPQESVHLAEWYTLNSPPPEGCPQGGVVFSKVQSTYYNWDNQLIPLRNAVNKQLEIARQSGKMGSALEAKVILYVHDPFLKKELDQFGQDLKYIFIVSEIQIEEGSQASSMAVLTEEYPHASIEVLKLDHEKCARCWHRCPELQNYQDYEGNICERCKENMTA